MRPMRNCTEKAKEEGKVTIYSISSRITKVANAFMEKYPGIEVEPFDISTNELLEKVTREYDAGQHVADVVHIKDQDGTLYNEYILAPASSITTSRQTSCRILMKSTPRRRPRCMSS